jgi:addiction module RelB/DinJ family antitoxin
MANTLLSIKTDETTKQELKSFAAELGVSSTALVNMVLRQVLRDKRIVLSTELEPTPYLQQVMKDAETDYRADRNITRTTGKKQALAHLDGLM